MKVKPEVGQVVYSLNVGNAARNREQILTPMIVQKVGRKYFTVCEKGDEESLYMHIMVHLESWQEKTEYTSSFSLYESKEEWEIEKETITLTNNIWGYFNRHGNTVKFSLEQLREIDKFIQEGNRVK